MPEYGVNNDGNGSTGHGLGDDPTWVTNVHGLMTAHNPYYMSYFAFNQGTNLFNITNAAFPNALAQFISLFG